jgi:ribosomal protein S18 acetylase RimI-like enzyme
MIGTPSQYSPSKLVGLHTPSKLKTGEYFMNIQDQDTIVGSLYVKNYKNNFIIRDVYVLESHRRKGYGKRLLEGILEFLIPKNKDIILYVDPTNPAKLLYNSLGFKLIKEGAMYGDKYSYIQ